MSTTLSLPKDCREKNNFSRPLIEDKNRADSGLNCTHHSAASIADLSAADVISLSLSSHSLFPPFPDVTKVRQSVWSDRYDSDSGTDRN